MEVGFCLWCPLEAIQTIFTRLIGSLFVFMMVLRLFMGWVVICVVRFCGSLVVRVRVWICSSVR